MGYIVLRVPEHIVKALEKSRASDEVTVSVGYKVGNPDLPSGALKVDLGDAQPLRAAALERAEVSSARDAAARTSLAALLDIIERTGGYLHHKDQEAIRTARALVVQEKQPEATEPGPQPPPSPEEVPHAT